MTDESQSLDLRAYVKLVRVVLRYITRMSDAKLRRELYTTTRYSLLATDVDHTPRMIWLKANDRGVLIDGLVYRQMLRKELDARGMR